MILSVIDRIYQFFEYNFLPGEQSDELKLLKWVKVSKKRFDVIKNKVQNAKNNNLQARSNRSSLINFNESDKTEDEEALKRIKNIRGDIKKKKY